MHSLFRSRGLIYCWIAVAIFFILAATTSVVGHPMFRYKHGSAAVTFASCVTIGIYVLSLLADNQRIEKAILILLTLDAVTRVLKVWIRDTRSVEVTHGAFSLVNWCVITALLIIVLRRPSLTSGFSGAGSME